MCPACSTESGIGCAITAQHRCPTTCHAASSKVLYDVEVRRVIATTNAIESINARYRRAVKARGHFPNEAAALKVPVSGHAVA